MKFYTVTWEEGDRRTMTVLAFNFKKARDLYPTHCAAAITSYDAKALLRQGCALWLMLWDSAHPSVYHARG